MSDFLWDPVEGTMNESLLQIVDPGPLRAPISSFVVRRDKDFELIMETITAGDAISSARQRPPGTLRINQDKVSFKNPFGFEAVAHGVQPFGFKTSYDRARGESETVETSSLHSVEATVLYPETPAYTVDWLENVRGFIWPHTVKRERAITETRTIGPGPIDLTIIEHDGMNSFGSECARVQVGAHEVYLCANWIEPGDRHRKPDCLIYRGTPDEETLKRIRNVISFSLGTFLVPLGHAVYSADWRMVSFKSISPYSIDGRVFDLARSLASEGHRADDRQRGYGWRWTYLGTQEQIAIARLGRTLIRDGDAVVSGTLAIGANPSEVSPDRMWSREFGAGEIASGVRFTPQGDLPLYVSTNIAGVPKSAPAADDRDVAIQRTYYTLDGKPWEPGPLREGDSLIVGLRLDAREAMPDALLVDLLPGGLEIENFNLTDAKQWADVVVDGITITDRAQAAEVRHEEFRDDRYVAALKLGQGQTAHVFYLVRAVSPGTYRVPPPLVEDMYRPDVRGIGRSVPATVKVVEP